MGVGDDRSNKETRVLGGGVTVAKGQGPISRKRGRFAPPTVKVDDEEISGLIELAEIVVAQKAPDDKQTRKMDAEQFKVLLREERREAPARAVEAVPVEAPMSDSKPVKKPALVVADHRYDTRFAAAHAPITKPPAMREAAKPVAVEVPAPVEVVMPPATSRTLAILVGVLAVAIVLAIAIVLIS